MAYGEVRGMWRNHGWWQFGGSNLQAEYGYGTEAQAEAYRARLNAQREINCYERELVEDAETIEWIEGGNEGFDLAALGG